MKKAFAALLPLLLLLSLTACKEEAAAADYFSLKTATINKISLQTGDFGKPVDSETVEMPEQNAVQTINQYDGFSMTVTDQSFTRQIAAEILTKDAVGPLGVKLGDSRKSVLNRLSDKEESDFEPEYYYGLPVTPLYKFQIQNEEDTVGRYYAAEYAGNILRAEFYDGSTAGTVTFSFADGAVSSIVITLIFDIDEESDNAFLKDTQTTEGAPEDISEETSDTED